MTPTAEWHREQSEYNERFYDRLQAAWPGDAHDCTQSGKDLYSRTAIG